MTALEAFERTLEFWEGDHPGMPASHVTIYKEQGLALLKEIRELRGAKAACSHESMSYIGNYPGPNRWKCFKCGWITPSFEDCPDPVPSK